jgi:hypothetical protein
LEGGDAPAPLPPPDDVLHAVKAEGGRRRVHRHRRNLGIAVLGLGLLAVPAAIVLPGDGSRRQEVTVASGPGQAGDVTADVAQPSTDEPAPTTLPPAVGAADPPAAAAIPVPATTPAAPTPAATATTAPPPSPGKATTATTARVCRNSADPACGDFRWDPAPAANQPLVASFRTPPATAAAGQTVVFEVTWSDGDAGLTFDHLSTDGTALAGACAMAPRYGPWTPPGAAAAGGTRPYATTFAEPGTYRVVVSLSTADCTSPYGNDTQVETTITVGPAISTG